MGRRQRKRLLRRRQVAAARRPSRRTAVVSGAVFAGTASLVAPVVVQVGATAPSHAGASPVAAGAGVVALAEDVRPGAASSDPSVPVAWRGGVLFSATGADGRQRLWRGDSSGVEPVFTDPPFDEATLGEVGGAPVVATQDHFFFVAEPADDPEVEALWVSDGTEGGTHPLATTEAQEHYDAFAMLAEVDGTLYFVEHWPYDDVGDPDLRLWSTDGTPGGTRLVRELPIRDPYVAPAGVAGGRVFFTTHAYDHEHSQDLWASDGTAAGTQRVLDSVGYTEGGVLNPVTVGDSLYFTSGAEGHGKELWRSDGTPEGTELVVDLLPGPKGSVPTTPMLVDGVLHFQTTRPDAALWRTSGTKASTKRVRKLPVRNSPVLHGSATLGEMGFFVVRRRAAGDYRSDLWRTDGTRKGTVRLTGFGDPDVTPWGGGVDTGEGLAVADGRVWFVAETTELGAELWSSDGTRKGTGPVADLQPAGVVNRQWSLRATGDQLWFTADDGSHGREPWRALPDASVAGATVAVPAKQGQPERKVRVKVRVGAAETVSVLVRAKVRVRGTQKWVRLRQRVQTLPGERTLVRLVAPRKGRKLAARAKVVVGFRDMAGHRQKEQLVVRLR